MKIKLVAEKYKPEYKTCGASGADLHARGNWIISPSETVTIPLGICFEIPCGYEVQIRPRSGLSKKGIFAQIGTIDSDYRGEVCAFIYNSTSKLFEIKDGDRICQMIYSPSIQINFEEVDSLSETKRGANGFGSTGR